MREEFGARGPGFARNQGEGLDTGLDMLELVEHAFEVYNGLARGIGIDEGELGDDDTTEVLPEASMEDGAQPGQDGDLGPEHDTDVVDDDLDAMELIPPTQRELLESAATLYAGVSLTTLGAALILLNCCAATEPPTCLSTNYLAYSQKVYCQVSIPFPHPSTQHLKFLNN